MGGVSLQEFYKGCLGKFLRVARVQKLSSLEFRI